MTTALWYADGLRWIGSLFNDAAERLERNEAEPLDPGAYREALDALNPRYAERMAGWLNGIML